MRSKNFTIFDIYIFNIYILYILYEKYSYIFKNKEKNIYEILHIIRHVRVRATRIIN